ncbi:hypothetical protein BH20ACT5_BH20ACT5_06330 [soil metagenome]
MIPPVEGLAAFGPATVAALLLAAYLLVGEPVAGLVLHRRFEAALTRDRTARRWLYHRLLLLEWGLVALVAGVVLLAPGVGWAELGLRWPDRAPGALAVGLTIGVLGVLVLSTRTVRGSRRRAVDTDVPPLPVPASPSVIALVPRTVPERRLFVGVALTAGFCEEVLYRGFLLAVGAALAPSAPDWALVILAGAVFGVVHAYQGRVGILATGVLGAVLAVLYLDSGSLLLPIAVHALIDLRILLLPISVLAPDEDR